MRVFQAIVCAALFAAAPAQAELVQVPSRPGVTVPIGVDAPSGTAAAWVLLYVGGNGRLALNARGEPTSELSVIYLIQSRSQLHKAGLGTVMVDVPSDRAQGYAPSDPAKGHAGSRRSPEHAADIGAIVRAIRQRYGRPVWLLGHSNGAGSVALAARRLTGAERPDGVVMTSGTVVRTRPSPDAPMEPFAYTGPVLVVAHQNDGCFVSPPADQTVLHGAFVSARPRTLRVLSGGSSGRGDPCHGMSPHSFVGMHGEVLSLIAGFIRNPH